MQIPHGSIFLAIIILDNADRILKHLSKGKFDIQPSSIKCKMRNSITQFIYNIMPLFIYTYFAG